MLHIKNYETTSMPTAYYTVDYFSAKSVYCVIIVSFCLHAQYLEILWR